jgi:hypothetical protein
MAYYVQLGIEKTFGTLSEIKRLVETSLCNLRSTNTPK